MTPTLCIVFLTGIVMFRQTLPSPDVRFWHAVVFQHNTGAEVKFGLK